MQVDFILSRSSICSHKSSVGKANTLLFTTELLTRNIEILKNNNDFEHRVSYSKLLEISTTFAIQKTAEAESRIALPSESRSNQQTNLVYDNIDRLE